MRVLPILTVAICILSSGMARGNDKLQIVGQIVDGKTGEPIVGATVQIADTTIGALTNVDGNYVVKKAPEGTHDLIVRCVGYTKMTVQGVIPAEGDGARYDLVLQPETIESGITVTVKGEAVRNTDASLLKERQLSLSVSDAISAEAISRSGSGDAAAALTKATGATVVGGKYVYVRGMGDRYTNTRLNNVTLPSPAADKQIAPMDLYPSALLDNIVIEKTFTPDQPGNFAGGSVNLSTKDLTSSRVMKVSSSAGYNTLSTFKGGFLTSPGGSKDWLGYDDGTRDIPDIFKDGSVTIPPPQGPAKKNDDLARVLDQTAKSFNKNMYPIDGYAPLNQKYSLAYGSAVPIFGTNASLLGSLTYSRNFKSYESGVQARWNLAERNSMHAEQILSDYKSTDEVLWGSILNAKLPIGNKNKLGLNYTYTRSAEALARYMEGPFEEAFLPPIDFQTRVVSYTSRDVGSLQLSGEHQFSSGRGISFDWQFAATNTAEDQPDYRTFSNSRKPISDGDTVYAIQSNQNPPPDRIYRNLNEKNREIDGNLSIPFNQWSGLPAKLKMGSGFLRKTRENSEREFQFQFGGIQPTIDKPEDFFDPSTFGWLDSTGSYNQFGSWYQEITKPRQSYDGKQEIFSLYSMIELPLFARLNLVTGARFERTLMYVHSADTSGQLDNKDVLPSVNFIYKLAKDMNLRLSYSKTLARPTFREFSPSWTYEYATGYIVNGSPVLKRSVIHNYDFRWEFFERPGELWAFSLFYKTIKDPIELGKVEVNNNIMYTNVEDGTVYGAEIEIRKQLDQVHRWLTHMQVGGNLTLVKSRVHIPDAEYETILHTRSNAKDYRPLEGQSPYALNVDLAYVNPEKSASIALNYNVFGERLIEKGKRATPDAYEQPRNQLDLTLSKGIYHGMTLKGAVKNILNASYRVTQKFDSEEYIRQEHKLGKEVSLGLSYEL